MQIKARERRPWRGKVYWLALTLAGGATLLGLALLLLLPASTIARLAWAPAGGAAAQIQRKFFRLLRSQRATLRADPDTLTFDLKFKHLQQIRFDRAQALAEGARNSDDNTWVPAKIRDGERRLKVKVRLKGVFRDHWEDPKKWSMLVKVKGGETYKSMKRFSVQRPSAREFIYEWLFLKMIGDEGLIALRIDFMEIVVNGESLGIYTLEEQSGKRLVENNTHREGPIVGFGSSGWLEMFRAHEGQTAGTFEMADIRSTQSGSIPLGTAMNRANRRALTLLEGFRRDQLDPGEVFELSELARLAAIYAIFGASEFDWRDLKFYLNPITNKLSPIGKEIHHQPALFNPGWWQGDDPGSDQTRFIRRLFDDDTFMRHYIRNLTRLSAPEYLDAFFERYAEGIERNMGLIAIEAPWFAFPSPDMTTAQAQIRAALHPWRPAHAHVERKDDETLTIEVGSVHHFPAELLGLVTASGKLVENPSGAPIKLKRRLTTSLPHYELQTYAFPLAAADTSFDTINKSAPGTDPRLPGLAIRVRVLGLDETVDVPVTPTPRFSPELVASSTLDARQYPPPADMFAINSTTKEILCRPGNFTIRRPIVIPTNHRLLCSGDVRWDLKDGAFILSYSPVELRGTADTPIRIVSSDRSGAGFAVVNARADSRLTHVQMSGLSTIARQGWTLTGALTFYQSPVHIERSHFSSNERGDDMLNIIRSTFEIHDTTFSDIKSDAFDSDFSQGKIVGGSYRDIGGDAIDTSGSTIDISGVEVLRAADKAMSFGEHSVASVRAATVRESHIGIVSKDLSRVQVHDSSIHDTAVGFAAFQKKPEFGPAELSATHVTLQNVPETMLVEVGSTVSIDGSRTNGTRTDVKARIYGPEL
ncbi:MAG: hypothetical protein V3V08_16755 [Nannocystaceae bacterium]